ncbi:MAG TPA: lysophospholipid acyltransferase family protein [Candidatus Angelobacter sp.]|nr:lysophospholipid acyltransferase family protein [Candidatus Angelobacter sp.]
MAEQESKLKWAITGLLSYLIIDPLIFVYTGILGSLSLLSSLFDRKGRLQHGFARLWSWLILKTCLTHVTVTGLDRVDTSKPHLYAANHISGLDIPVLYTQLPFQFRIIAKEELFHYPFLGWHLRRSRQIPVDATSAASSMRSLNRAAETLRAGMPMVVFPEGGRSASGQIRPFLSGAFYVAIKTQVEVVPIAIVGTFEMLPINSFHMRPRPLKMLVGDPIPTQGYTVRDMEKLAAIAQKAVEDLYYAHAEVMDHRQTLAAAQPASVKEDG